MLADLNDLEAGDCLLYGPKGFFGWIITVKTWHDVAHVECYVGNGLSVASRDGVGVGQFEFRQDRLKYILRPNQPFDLEAALKRFDSEWRGQGYDWLGLLRFGWREPVSAFRFLNKQFCSEFLARFYRAGGLDPFNRADADSIAPFQFLLAWCFDVYEVGAGGELAVRKVAA